MVATVNCQMALRSNALKLQKQTTSRPAIARTRVVTKALSDVNLVVGGISIRPIGRTLLVTDLSDSLT